MGIVLALVHHPVLDKHGRISTTAVTNVDLHDLARAGRTYGVEKFFVVTPIELQKELTRRVVWHWVDGPGGKRVKSRPEAFGLIEVVDDLETAIAKTQSLSGQPPLLTVTGAKLTEDAGVGEITSYEALRKRLAETGETVLLLFGTGYGLAPSIIDQADIRLPAIVGPGGIGDYNHLSVRAAAVVVMDRLAGS